MNNVPKLPDTCTLNQADKDGLTLEEVGAIIGLTRERIRQLEVRAMSKIYYLVRREDRLGRPLPERNVAIEPEEPAEIPTEAEETAFNLFWNHIKKLRES